MTRFISGWQVRKSWGIRAGGRALPGGGSGSAGTHSPWPREPPVWRGHSVLPSGVSWERAAACSLCPSQHLCSRKRLTYRELGANWQELHSRGLGSGGAGTPKAVSQEWEEGVRASGRGWGDRGGGKHEGRAGAQAKDEGSSGLSQTDSAPGQPSPIHFLISEKARSPAVSGAGA